MKNLTRELMIPVCYKLVLSPGKLLRIRQVHALTQNDAAYASENLPIYYSFVLNEFISP